MKIAGKNAAALLLILGGLAKLPLEQRMSDDLHGRNLLETPVGMNLREGLGQAGFAAALGGLRSLVASITYLQAYGAFEDVDWGRVDSLMTLTTRLQPREAGYWDEASWHMAYNAASFYERTEPNEVIRNRLFRDYVHRGVSILHEGLRFLPGNKKLLMTLGKTCAERERDPRKAAEFLLKAYHAGAGDFYERQAAYQLAQLSDRPSWEKSYEILKRYYDAGLKKKGTTIMQLLPVLEERLGIPPEKRSPAMPEDDPPKKPAGIPKTVPRVKPPIPGAQP